MTSKKQSSDVQTATQAVGAYQVTFYSSHKHRGFHISIVLFCDFICNNEFYTTLVCLSFVPYYRQNHIIAKTKKLSWGVFRRRTLIYIYTVGDCSLHHHRPARVFFVFSVVSLDGGGKTVLINQPISTKQTINQSNLI